MCVLQCWKGFCVFYIEYTKENDFAIIEGVFERLIFRLTLPLNEHVHCAYSNINRCYAKSTTIAENDNGRVLFLAKKLARSD